MQIARNTSGTERHLLLDYIDAKRDADRALRRLENAEAKLLNTMEKKQRKTFSFSIDGVKHTATYTQRSTNQIDEKGLRKALTAKVFDKYVVKKLDRKALEKAMTDGDVDPVTVAKFVQQVPGKTYLTYRTRNEEDEAASV